MKLEHKKDISIAELYRWLKSNELVSFGSVQALAHYINNGTIRMPTIIRGKKLYNTIDVCEDLQRAGVLLKKVPTLEELPMPKEGQSQEEYMADLGINPSLSDANIFYTVFRGKLAQQKYLVESQRLVLKSEVEDKAFAIARVVRDQMLAIPERVSGELSVMTDQAEIREMLYEAIINALSAISDDKPFS